MTALPVASRDRMALGADWLAMAAAASLPWSTSATGIVVVLWLIALAPTLDGDSARRLLKRPAAFLPVVLVAVAAFGATETRSQAAPIPILAYKRFCYNLARGQPVMAANCEAQEVLAYRQLRTIWRSPPSDRIQGRCSDAGIVSRASGTGSYVKYLNCIITYMGLNN